LIFPYLAVPVLNVLGQFLSVSQCLCLIVSFFPLCGFSEYACHRVGTVSSFSSNSSLSLTLRRRDVYLSVCCHISLRRDVYLFIYPLSYFRCRDGYLLRLLSYFRCRDAYLSICHLLYPTSS
jgi:hypothetical protein